MHKHLFIVGELARAPASYAGMHVAADDKAFRTLAAEVALAGYELIDEVGIDGARRLYMVHKGQSHHLDSLDAARAHLAQIADHQ